MSNKRRDSFEFMKLAHDFRKIAKPVLLWMLLYTIFSMVFVALYVYIDYQSYLSSYQTTQQTDFKKVQSKLHSQIETLKKLSVLTGNRIVAARGGLKRIQNILNSVLPPYKWSKNNLVMK